MTEVDHHERPGDACAEPEACAQPGASNAAAVSQLFREHNRVLVGFLTARLRSEQEAKEVAQEAYVRLLQLHEPGTPSLLRAYLFKIAANLAVDRLRHRTVRHRAETQVALFEELTPAGRETDDPAQQLLDHEQTELLLGFLGELPLKCQQIIDLHRFQGVPQHEVAVSLQVSERMVRRYVTYAMVYCHLRLEGFSADQVRRTVSL
jgi:RNA polymerase sigma-70 factor (ECF subfamily)